MPLLFQIYVEKNLCGEKMTNMRSSHCDGMYKDMANNICGKHVVESLPSQSMKYDFEFEN